MIPLYSQIGLALIWVIFILELFTVMHIMAHNKVGVVVWSAIRVTPLLLVTLGVV